VAHTVFSLLHRYLWYCVVEEGGLACGASFTQTSAAVTCSYEKGGPFITASARDMLFHGCDSMH
jgi:hypothetical protein